MEKMKLGRLLAILLSFTIVLIGAPSIRVMVNAAGILTNGDFEYANEAAMKSDFGYGSTAVRDTYISLSADGGRNSSKALLYGTGGSSSWATRALYRTVTVEPNTNYKWTLWVKFNEQKAANVAGLAVADSSGARIESTITSSYGSGGTISAGLLDIFNGINTPAANEWLHYTVLFNSGTQTSVRLYFTQYDSTVSSYLDDWSLKEVVPPVPGELTNGDFEYEDEAEMTNDFGYGSAAVRTYISQSADGGRYSSKALLYGTGGSSSWATRALYRTVTVEPNTNYKWTLWVKFAAEAAGGNMAGLAVADSGGTRLVSEITPSSASGGAISTSLLGIFNGISNPAANEWLQYTVIFNSGTQTSVRLYFTQYDATVSAYLDDWDLEEYIPTVPGILTNGDFEYKNESAMKNAFGYGSDAVRDTYISLSADGGRNSSKALLYGTGGSSGWAARSLYRTVIVEPDTTYKWTLWIKFTAATESSNMAGLAVADSSGVRMESDIMSSFGPGGTVSGLLGIFTGIKTPTANEWLEYTVQFNTGTNTSVRLCFAQYDAAVSAFLDDWNLTEYTPPVPGVLTNGDFEYADEAAMKSDFGYGSDAVRDTYISLSADGGRNSSKAMLYEAGGTSGWAARALYRTVTVEPDTNYKWTVWLKFSAETAGTNMAGLAVADSSGARMESDIMSSFGPGGTVTGLLSIFTAIKDPTPNVWVQYTALFHSGTKTSVRLYFTQFDATVSAYLDNWNLKEVLPPIPGVLTNGDFEYEDEAEMTNDFGYGNPAVRSYVSLSEDGGRNGSKALLYGTGGSSAWAARALYKTVTVNPDTDYKWTLWVKFSTDISGSVAGLAVADSGGTRMNSNITSSYGSGGTISTGLLGIFNGISDPAANEWLQYTVLFNSGTQTSIRLYFTQYDAMVSACLDDWILEEVTISVDLEWGVMSFEYVGETWDPVSHTYTGGDWICDSGANKITMTNHSNIPVIAAFAYGCESGYTEIAGVFKTDGGALIGGPVTIPSGNETQQLFDAYLILQNQPAVSFTDQKIGTVTVTIDKH